MKNISVESMVAKDIEALCGKCGESWHVVVAVADGAIAQVQCKQCGGTHKYRPIARDRMTLKKNTKSSVAIASDKVAPKTKTSAVRSSAAKAPVPAVEANDKEIQKYNIKAVYEVGDRIQHPKYGVGVVEALDSDLKMTVCFSQNRAVLIYGR